MKPDDGDFNDLYYDFLEHLEGEPQKQAYLLLNRLIEENPAQAWSILQSLINSAPTEDLIENIGAGHLEDLIKQHGENFLGRLRDEGFKNAKLRLAISISRVDPKHCLYERLESLKTDLEKLS